MKTPGWAMFVGLAMILFGGCGVMNSATGLVMGTELDKYVDQIRMDIEENEKDHEELDTIGLSDMDSTQVIQKSNTEKFDQELKDSFQISPYFQKWVIRLTWVALIAYLIYAIAGVLFLMKKPSAIMFSYFALGIFIIFGVAQMIIYHNDPEPGIFSMVAKFAPLVSIVLDIILFLVVLTSDKSAYYPEPYIEDEYD